MEIEKLKQECIDFINKNYKEYKRYFIFRTYEDTNFKDKELDFLFEFENDYWDGIAFKFVEKINWDDKNSYYILIRIYDNSDFRTGYPEKNLKKNTYN